MDGLSGICLFTVLIAIMRMISKLNHNIEEVSKKCDSIEHFLVRQSDLPFPDIEVGDSDE